MPEVQSAASYGGVAQRAGSSARECSTLRKVALVQHSPLFTNISPADCREIVSAANEGEFSRRETIFLEGDPIRHVSLLTSGSVKVIRLGKSGTEVILRLAGPGEVVEMTRFPDQCRHCSMAQALTASTALIWEASAFQVLAERFPALGRNISKVITQRLQRLASSSLQSFQHRRSDCEFRLSCARQ